MAERTRGWEKRSPVRSTVTRPSCSAGARARASGPAPWLVIAGGPHAIIWTHADEVNQALLDFIGHPGRPADGRAGRRTGRRADRRTDGPAQPWLRPCEPLRIPHRADGLPPHPATRCTRRRAFSAE